jgi:putative tryptophan/tyrosine transport system substrate-binding protein
MKRREFISLTGGAALSLPRAVFAQPADRLRRVGVLMNFEAADPQGQARAMAFVQGLKQLGWTEGGNARFDTRWSAGDADRDRQYSAELLTLAPDVILASSSASVAALQRATHDVPIVFANVIDPVGAGFVASLARPGGNITGFSAFEYSIGGKWVELLKEVAPNLNRIAVLRDPALPAGIGQFAAIQALIPPTLGIELTPIDVRDPAEIERAVAAFAAERNGGLVVTASPQAATHLDLIIALAKRYRLPNVYPFASYPASGGLASYGPNAIDEYARAAVYVDRILRGEKPSDLPVQTPTKYDLVINLKSANELGLDIPATVLARADKVIE